MPRGSSGAMPGETGHVGDVRLGVVLTRRGPATDDGTDGVETVLMIIGTREQIEGCPPTILQRFELAEGTVCLYLCETFPLILRRATDVQRVAITNSSW